MFLEEFDGSCLNLSKEVLQSISKAHYVTKNSLCKRTLRILKSNKEVLHLEAGPET
jgi:hypothetical protein